VHVTAFVRPTSDRSALEALGAQFVVGDALDGESVRAAFSERAYSAVVTTLGCNFCDAPPDYDGNRNVFDAAEEAGVLRVIFISSIGAGNSNEAMPWFARFVLKGNLKRKTQAEEHLHAGGLDYTIIRPGNLQEGEATGESMLSEDPSTSGVIRRSDLAAHIVDALDNDATIRKVYAAVSTAP
jgi:nucleoside-diphosphate-sugar epimerase